MKNKKEIHALKKEQAIEMLDAIVKNYGGQYTDDNIIIGATCVYGNETVLIKKDDTFGKGDFAKFFKNDMYMITISNLSEQFSDEIYEFGNKYIENFLSQEQLQLLNK